MINELEIHNFKSIKDLTLPCKRFNIFIGEPNTGKSNILEALGLISFIGMRQYYPEVKLDGFVRHEQLSNLFYDEEVGEGSSIRCDSLKVTFSYIDGEYFGNCYATLPNEQIIGIASVSGSTTTFNKVLNHFRSGEAPRTDFTEPSKVRFYRYTAAGAFASEFGGFLLAPNGPNLPSLLLQNRNLRITVNQPILSVGLHLGIRPQENKIELVKQADDIIISYPYSLASDTLKRMTFFTVAIETSDNSVVVLEEPEAHSFPGETKLLAEQIAMDENDNQYFIVTHNPYFLMPLFSKAPKDDISINIVYSEDYQTKVRPLEEEELPELFELDIFSNMERYLEEQ